MPFENQLKTPEFKEISFAKKRQRRGLLKSAARGSGQGDFFKSAPAAGTENFESCCEIDTCPIRVGDGLSFFAVPSFARRSLHVVG